MGVEVHLELKEEEEFLIYLLLSFSLLLFYLQSFLTYLFLLLIKLTLIIFTCSARLRTAACVSSDSRIAFAASPPTFLYG